MEIVVVPFCLGNNDKKYQYMFSTDTIFFPNIFNPIGTPRYPAHAVPPLECSFSHFPTAGLSEFQ
jgi:hypothetical protein